MRLIIFSILIQQAVAFSIYVFVSRIKDSSESPHAYIYAEETIGNRDCEYLNIPTSFINGPLNFTQNNCSSPLYPPMAVVYKYDSNPRNISYVISEDRKQLFVCEPFSDHYTDNDSLEFNCMLTRLNSYIAPTNTRIIHSSDFAGQTIIIVIIFLVLLLLLLSFLFRPLPLAIK